jgi:hypothetical protein
MSAYSIRATGGRVKLKLSEATPVTRNQLPVTSKSWGDGRLAFVWRARSIKVDCGIVDEIT